MRAAAILGLGSSARNLQPFQADTNVEWRLGVPATCDSVDAILLFGGDGTIHRHLGRLVNLGLPVLVVPVGSGNDFARALGLRRIADALAAWNKFCAGAGNVRAVDLGLITPTGPGAVPDLAHNPSSRLAARYFCCVAGVGLDGDVARRANQLPRWLRGHGGYALSLAPTIFSFAPFPMKIFARARSHEEDQEIRESETWAMRSDHPAILAAFANTPFYGGGMKIAPRAEMDDGLLDVCIVGNVSRFRLASLFPSVYAGRHLKIREVEYFKSAAARIETQHPLDVYADGEFVCQTPVEIRIEPAALPIITP
jgi:diacylglycerol kinase (ATP)